MALVTPLVSLQGGPQFTLEGLRDSNSSLKATSAVLALYEASLRRWHTRGQLSCSTKTRLESIGTLT